MAFITRKCLSLDLLGVERLLCVCTVIDDQAGNNYGSVALVGFEVLPEGFEFVVFKRCHGLKSVLSSPSRSWRMALVKTFSLARLLKRGTIWVYERGQYMSQKATSPFHEGNFLRKHPFVYQDEAGVCHLYHRNYTPPFQNPLKDFNEHFNV